MDDHVKLVEGKKYKYRRPDGNNFTLRRHNPNTNNWDPVQVGDIVTVQRRKYKILSIAPDEVILEHAPVTKK